MSHSTETNQFNFAALKTIDPQFHKIHGAASHVAVYRYSTSTQSWEKTDTAGCLFLYDRSAYPHYGLVVMNRENANNFVQKFTAFAQFVMEQPYILIRSRIDMYSDPRDEGSIIYCIWFYEPKDCVATANILRDMGLKYEGEGETFDKVGECRCHLGGDSPSSKGNHAGNTLFQILRKEKDMHFGRQVPDNVISAEELKAMMLQESFDNTDKRSQSHNSEFTAKKVVSYVEDNYPLTEEQMVESCLYLLQTDSDFLKKLQDGYMRSVQQKNSCNGR